MTNLLCTCTHPLWEHGEDGCTKCECQGQLPLVTPGVYASMPAEYYHRLPFVGSTTLKAFRECPASVLMEREVTEAMKIGQAAHCYVLEGEEEFHKRFAIEPEPPLELKDGEYKPLNKNTNKWKAIKERFDAEHEGFVILPAKPRGVDVPTLDVLREINASLRSHPDGRMFLDGPGLQETSLIWRDAETGLMCKSRIDRNPGRKTIVEIKMCANIRRFDSIIEDENYDVQMAHQVIAAIENGIDTDSGVFLAAQPAPPFESDAVLMDPDYLDASKTEWRRLLNLYAECKAANYFPRHNLTGINSMKEVSSYALLRTLEKKPWRFSR